MKIAAPLALLSLLLLLPLLGLAAEEDVVLEVHDVRDLVTPGRTLESLAKEVRVGAGEGLTSVLPQEKGILITRGTRAALARVKATLEAIRKEPTQLVMMQVCLFEIGDDLAARARSGNVEFIDGMELLADWSDREGVQAVTAPRITCYDAQRVEISAGTKVEAVVDFEVRKEDGGLLVDPVVEEILAGARIGIRPVTSADRRFVTLVIDCRLATPMPAPESAPLAAAPGIATREVREFRLRRSVTVPRGKALLLGLGDASGDGKRLAMLVMADPFDLDGELPEAPEIDLTGEKPEAPEVEEEK